MTQALSLGVVTPSLNQGRYLAENIESLAHQGIQIRQVIIDGGSSDETLDVINSYSHRLFSWLSEPDSGQSHAINKGLRLLDCDWVTWLNSDDYYLPRSLLNVCQFIKANPAVDVVHGYTQLVDDDSNILGVDHGQSYGLPYRYYSGMCFPQPSSIIRTSVLSLVGDLSEDLHYAMDYELFLRIKLIGGCFKRICFPVAAYRLHSASKTVSSPMSFAEEWLQVYNNFLGDEPCANNIIPLLESLNLYRTPTRSYRRTEYLGKKSLELTFYYALHYQAFFRYQAQHYSQARTLAQFMISYKPFNRLMPPMIRMWTASILKG